MLVKMMEQNLSSFSSSILCDHMLSICVQKFRT